MKKLLLVAFSILMFSIFGQAQAYPEVSCAQYGSSANSCDQCFDGGSKYVGDVFRPNDVFNAGSNDRLYFDDENPIVYSVETLNTNTSWFTSSNLLQYPDTFVWNKLDNRDVHVFRAGTSERFLETQPGKGIRLQSVSTDTVSPDDAAFKLTFTSKYRTWLGGRNIGDLQEHRECVFYKPNYCGDGLVDAGHGETCDPSDPNRTGWGTGGCDTNTCQPIEAPVCNGLTVTPTSGVNPVTSSVTCEGYKVNTFKIDCGNGTELTANGSGAGTEQFSGTCTYTDAGTYTPTCIINDTISSNSCRKTVTVTNPVPDISIDKRDANTDDLDGNIGNDTQTVNSGDRAVFRITVTNTGAEGLREVTVSDPKAVDCRLDETEALNKIRAIGNRDDVFDVNENFSYICERPNTTEDYKNVATTNGIGVVSGDPVDATDDTDVKLARDYDLALVKTVSGNANTYSRGDSVTYAITVYNQGDIDASNIVVTDYIPTGMTLDDASWVSSSATQATKTIASIPAGENRVISITLKIGNGVTGSVINWAEISSDDGDDIDSTPDTNNNNDCHGSIGRGGISDANDNRTNGTGDANNNGTCESDEDEDDHDPARIIVSDASIDILKYSANQEDSDGNLVDSNNNDSQTVEPGADAVFKIKVTNTGNEDLDTIVLTDAVAPNCAGSVTLPSTYPTTWSNFVVGGSGNNSDAILQPGESFEYTCINSNATTNYTNIADVNARSVTTGSSVPEASDNTQVRIAPNYDLALTKTVAGTSTSFAPGDTVTFNIEVINQGGADAFNVQIADYIPEGLELGDNGINAWVLNGNIATWDVGTILAGDRAIFPINLRVKSTTDNGPIINWAEISSDDGDDVDSTPDTDNDNDCHGGLTRDAVSPSDDNRTDGTGDANNNGICESGEDEDDHDPAVITIGSSAPSITIDKTDANSADLDDNVGNDTQTVNTGSGAVFKITVTNDGTEDLDTIVLTDALAPNCAGSVTLPGTFPSTWSNFTTTAIGNALKPGETFSYTCAKADTQGDYTNSARVDAKGVTSGTDVDATDTTEVLVLRPSIAIDKTDANSADRDGSQGNDTQTVTRGNEAVFKITVTNDGTEDLDTIVLADTLAPNCAGSVTLPGTFPSTWSNFTTTATGNVLKPGETFSYTCTKANTQGDYTNSARVDAQGVDSDTPVDDTDTTPVIVDGGSSSSSSSSSGGSSAQCQNIDVALSGQIGTVTCTGNSRVKSYRLDCGNGQVLEKLNDSRTTSETFTCNYDPTNGGAVATGQAVCEVSAGGTNATTHIWRTRFQCKSDIPMPQKVCGDGILQVPNGAGVNEQCERVIDQVCSDGSTATKNADDNYECDDGTLAVPTLGAFPSTCTSTCKLRTTSSSSGGSSGRPVITIPSHGNITFYPQGKVIIGNAMNAFEEFGALTRNPTIVNDSDYDLFFDKLCILKDGSSLDGQSENCIDMGGILYPGEKVGFTDAQVAQYTANTANITSGTYGDNNLQTTIKHDGVVHRDAYFAADLEVRVSKPTIVTVGGGTSYVKDTAEVSDTRNVGNLFVDNKNRNFEGFSVSDSDALSNVTSTETTDTRVVDSVVDDNIDDAANAVDTGATVSSNIITYGSAIGNYNGINNVYVVSGGDTLVIPAGASFSETSTYVVEDGGKLVIEGDINANGNNLAFVTKGGDIEISSSAKNIDGTFIAIGGRITSDATTSEQLVVNGSLYGNVNDLVSKRTYVRQASGGSMSVGTVVSFGSSIFKKPAPLVGQFIGEYLESKKVAR